MYGVAKVVKDNPFQFQTIDTLKCFGTRPRSPTFKAYFFFRLETSLLEQMCPKPCRSSEKKFEDWVAMAR